MAISYRESQFVGNPNLKEPIPYLVSPAQDQTWNRGDILGLETVGTIVAPPGVGTGALASAAGPLASAVTITNAATAGAQPHTYFIELTYTATSAESAVSQLFVQNCPAGYTPSVTVASAGAPAGATDFAAYIGLSPTSLALQQATKTTTALGSAYVATSPLTNYTGAFRVATNVASNIAGIAIDDSGALLFGGYSGSFTAGTVTSLFGSSNSMQPLMATDAPLNMINGLGNGAQIEMNLNTASGAFTQALISQTAGITLDPATNFYTVDTTQSNKVCRIVDARQGVYIGPTASSDSSGLGTRVIVSFLPSVLALS